MTALPAVTLLATGLLLYGAERRWPCRGGVSMRGWLANMGLFVLAMLLVVGAAGAAGLALPDSSRGEGWSVLPLGLLLLDLGQYTVHRLEHRVGLLWHLHRTHHTDPEMDVSTGLRFHPLETLLRTSVTIALVLLLGLPGSLVLLYAAASYAINNFAHADISLPAGLDRALRWIIVTPDMHRIHHSTRRIEQDSNLGAILSWWDRLFGTYIQSAAVPPTQMRIGVERFEGPHHGQLGWMLLNPWLDDSGTPLWRRA